MGSGESTRRVTLERDTGGGGVGIVRISENVVRRLKGKSDLPLGPKDDVSPEDINKLWSELQREKAHLQSQRERIQSMLERVYQREQESEEMHVSNEGFISNQEIEIRQKELDEREQSMVSKEIELQTEIETLQKKNSEIQNLTEDHFNLAVEEVQQKFSQGYRPAVCQDTMKAALDCFQENPQHTLRCSKLVQQFVSCVETSRLTVLQESKSQAS